MTSQLLSFSSSRLLNFSTSLFTTGYLGPWFGLTFFSASPLTQGPSALSPRGTWSTGSTADPPSLRLGLQSGLFPPPFDVSLFSSSLSRRPLSLLKYGLLSTATPEFLPAASFSPRRPRIARGATPFLYIYRQRTSPARGQTTTTCQPL